MTLSSLFKSSKRKIAFLTSLFGRSNPLGALVLTNTSFRFLRRRGVHVTPVHFYSVVPDLREMEDQADLWSQPHDCTGIDFDVSNQRLLMQNVFAHYRSLECDFPEMAAEHQYHTDNVYFGYISAVAMHSFIRKFKPRKIIEIGAGNSTLLIREAIRRNVRESCECELVAIDPYPPEFLQRDGLGMEMITKRVQDVGVAPFLALQENDIVSIDSSHAVRTGGDVNFLYLDVLPRLPVGVLVHIHDIFLPYEYPKEWLERRIFWNEQYLLHALLAHAPAFRVLWAQRLMETAYPDEFQAAFERTSRSDNHESYSFWIRREASETRAPGNLP